MPFDSRHISSYTCSIIKRHSTSTNLLDSINDWSISLHNKSSTIVAYVDFQRAFDSLSHNKLIHKLISYGISGNLLYWIKSFLTNRTQIVRVGNHLSNPCPVSSGVPQGSVLGPILFILFINDVTDSFHDSVFAQLFADDIKIYTTLTHSSDYTSFQNHLDLIHAWSSAWQLPIPHSKCNVFEIGKRFQPVNNHTFNISSIPLISLQSTSDLGITIDNTLTFNNHIQCIIFRANQRSHLIHRCLLSLIWPFKFNQGRTEYAFRFATYQFLYVFYSNSSAISHVNPVFQQVTLIWPFKLTQGQTEYAFRFVTYHFLYVFCSNYGAISHVNHIFLQMTLIWPFRIWKGQTDYAIRFAAYHFLYLFYSNYSAISHGNPVFQ